MTRSPTLPPPPPPGMAGALERNIRAVEARARQEVALAGWSALLAHRITDWTGSMAFVLFHLVLFGAWIAASLGAFPAIRHFDPSFSILGMAASVEAIFLSTFVLISQNRMAAAAAKRADLDLQINLLAEHELTRVAQLVRLLAERAGIRPEEMDDLAEIERDIAPEAVMDEIERRRA